VGDDHRAHREGPGECATSDLIETDDHFSAFDEGALVRE
jgi:hypothetical protein